jgi:hypothetical protein
MDTETEVPNIITTTGGDYEDPPIGESLYGLVGIKVRQAKVFADGKDTGTTEPKYMLTFRCVENPKAFYNLSFRPKWNEKATMYQVLRAATNKKLRPTSTPDDAYTAMMALRTKWFMLDLAVNKYGKIALVTNDAVTPHEGPQGYTSAIKYFEEIDAAKKYGTN